MHLSANTCYNTSVDQDSSFHQYVKAVANGGQLWCQWPSLVVFGWDL